MDVVSRFERLLNLHSELLVLIFHLTAGHVGAVVAYDIVPVESLVSTQNSPWAAVYEIRLHVRSVDRGAFGRGLSEDSELSVVVALFQRPQLQRGHARQVAVSTSSFHL